MAKAKKFIFKSGNLKLTTLTYPRTRSKIEAEKRFNRLKKLKYKPQIWKSQEGYSVTADKWAKIKRKRKK